MALTLARQNKVCEGLDTTAQTMEFKGEAKDNHDMKNKSASMLGRLARCIYSDDFRNGAHFALR
jgi:hypothetical protein